ncbi:transporter substrate-binding domain-containing protein [Gimibacter soli]|uniref:Solute-binding protein family 3/N-terminal domain-containing protein n=1 Tax=Gimibacter soli TaxID=3024400 RepID=A0AAF0BLY7_9PROT|nr:transporter substrate-binding domain-containing protein [Gimibacter soli]WCL53746.1 hypothetical protein PH603_14490 [Gimibacter soli]
MRIPLRIVSCLMASLWLYALPATAEDKLPVVDIYLDRGTEVLIRKDRDRYAVAAVDKLKRFMDRTGLRYRLRYLPWSRAMRLIEKNPKALIYQLLRTPEREERFHWIMQVFDGDALHLIALDTTPEARLKLPEILKGNTLIGCQKATAHCDVVRKLGVSEERIMEVPAAVPTALEQMLLRQRVDFIIAYKSTARSNFDALGEDPARAVFITPLDSSDDYLAAPAGIDPAILAKLLAVPLADFPLLETPSR